MDVTRHVPEAGDVLLLCSDGLSGMVPDPQLQDLLRSQDDLQTCAQSMIDAANAAGGTDNITCVLVRFAA